MTLQQQADDLAKDMHDAQLSQFGPSDYWVMNTRTGPEPSPVCAFPSVFFNDTVTVALPQGGFRQEAPRYCASSNGAGRMLDLVQSASELMAGPKPELFDDWPQGSMYGGGYTPSEKVPWIRLGERVANVGLQLEYFTHGYPGEKALIAALGEFRATSGG